MQIRLPAQKQKVFSAFNDWINSALSINFIFHINSRMDKISIGNFLIMILLQTPKLPLKPTILCVA